ncbi:hypothetical protein, partial [Mycobacterium kansasii]|uniref:hypothetical protein n=1 Tax=Mycobacterium kansasii TaxID=1768 RepID=UPI002806100B
MTDQNGQEAHADGDAEHHADPRGHPRCYAVPTHSSLGQTGEHPVADRMHVQYRQAGVTGDAFR